MSTSIVNLSRLASVMSLSFEFQEQLRALEGATQKEKQTMSTLSSEINQFQDEVREGYVPEKKATPETDARFRQAGMARAPVCHPVTTQTQAVVAQDVGALARCHGLTRPVSTISQSA